MDTQTDKKMQVTTRVSSDEMVPVQAMSFDPTHDPIYGVDTKPAVEKDGMFACPHCGANYDESGLEDAWVGTHDLCIMKDPCYCEASGSCTSEYKCRKCGGNFTIDWDWDF